MPKKKKPQPPVSHSLLRVVFGLSQLALAENLLPVEVRVVLMAAVELQARAAKQAESDAALRVRIQQIKTVTPKDQPE